MGLGDPRRQEQRHPPRFYDPAFKILSRAQVALDFNRLTSHATVTPQDEDVVVMIFDNAWRALRLGFAGYGGRAAC